MATVTNILSLLKSFAMHQKSGYIHYIEFADYMRRFAQKHIAEHPEMANYLSQSQEHLQKELQTLSDSKKIHLVMSNGLIKGIVVPAYLGEVFLARINEASTSPTVPYPLLTDLQKNIPTEVIERKTASDLVVQLLDGSLKPDANVVYGMVIPKDLPVIMIPGHLNGNLLIDVAMGKIRHMLRKEEYHDYFLKKLKISNPGKELTAKNFFNQFVTKPTESLESLKNSGDSFYYWSQLCFFIRQDYEKVKDFTAEDISVLQSVYITEFAASFFKNKAQQDLQRATALKNLEQILTKPPYYFNKDTILRFVDSKGIPLLGQYSNDDLNNYLKEQTTISESNELPTLLTFKTYNDQVYYINKTRVLPLIMRLCADARDTVKSNISKEWYGIYKQFETVPEMSDSKIFEKRLEQEVKLCSPILYALLNSNFLSLVHYEARVNHDQIVTKINLFANGTLVPYSELLLINRQELVSDAKIMLPIWYTIPIISWIAALILKPSKKEKKRKQKSEELKAKKVLEENEENTSSPKKADRKTELRKSAISLEEKLVPEGSTLERELAAYVHQWNRILNKKLAMDLTEDVNSLIRDYIRKVIKTLQGSTFTMERIQNLAETLAKTPSLSKIQDKEQLTMYIQLYIVKLVKNIQ